jgi:hypothetical protein
MSASKSGVVSGESERVVSPDAVGLAHGRLLTVDSAGAEQFVEIRAASGIVELRVKITEDGPVLLIEGVRISLKAAESVQVDCPRFTVTTSHSIEMASQGTIQVSGAGDVCVDAKGEVHVKGEMIHLN